jgi:hypothetical protein
VLLIIQEHIVSEARALANSRLVMHRIGDKSQDEYRTQVQADIDLLGGFVEDEERVAAVAELTEDEWYEDYLRHHWAGHPEYVGPEGG